MKLGLYWTLGDHGLERSLCILTAAARAGADLLEVGLPFSDPLLDGPVIQASHTRALAAGEFAWGDVCQALTTLKKSLEHVADVQNTKRTQISLMASCQLFYEPQRAQTLPSVDGILLTDIAWNQPSPFALGSPRVWFLSQNVVLTASAKNSNSVNSAPNNDVFIERAPEDISMIYLTRLQGLTGAGQNAAQTTAQAIAAVRRISQAPLWLGFGVSNRAEVEECARWGADGAVVGSAFVSAVHQFLEQNTNCTHAALERFVENWVTDLHPSKTVSS
jgi:tryptophan synthase alpha subunit